MNDNKKPFELVDDRPRKRRKKERKINPRKYRRLVRREKWEDLRHLAVFVVFTVIMAATVSFYGFCIPIYEETKEAMFDSMSKMSQNTFLRAGNTNIYDTDGKLIGRIGNEKYEYVEADRISPYVTKGYIAKEDRNFSMHMGVDIKGTTRAVVAYITHKGEITQGGSTITQQVIKNNLLTQEKRFKRKITEIFIALQMEKEYNKIQIMEFYCNSNYYGNGCYGIEGASQYYFGHSAMDLSLAEAAMMVATSNSPNNYNPVADYGLCMEKKKLVLDDMAECGYITNEEYMAALEEEPVIVQKSENVANENYMITYAIHCAALKLMEYEGFEFKYTFDSSEEYEEYDELYKTTYTAAVASIRSGGYEIYTSLNPDIQKIFQKAIDKGMVEYDEKNEEGIYTMQSAGVCVDNSTGLVVAVVGGREGKGSYNRGYQARRQSGSAIKPLLDYGPAYNEGIYTPSSVLVDEPVNIDGYKPTNAWAGYAGEITSREALLRSYNTIAVKTYMKTTKPVALSYLESMRFSTLTYSDMIAPALAVGGFTVGVTPADMAKGYATLASGGNYVENDCIKSLVSYTGTEVYSDTGSSHEVYTEDTAFMINDILSGMFQENFMPGKKFQKSDQIYMGKTGTTNNNKDAWFCGSSAYYSASVWMGYDIPKEMKNVAGGNKPCEIWTKFMDSLHDKLGLERKEFNVPGTVMLSNSDGSVMEVGYSENVYKSRPEGYDYISMILKEKREDEKRKEDEKVLEERAEQATEDFERFQITTVQEAQSVDEMYNEVYMLVNSVSDDEIRIDLLERIAYKYQILSGNLAEKWENAIDAYNKSLQAKLNEENNTAAVLSEELAYEAEKSYRISMVESYINLLNMQSGYISIMESWIIQAEAGMQSCTEYEAEYVMLRQNLDDAVMRIRTLQINGIINETIDQPSILPPVQEDAGVSEAPFQSPDDAVPVNPGSTYQEIQPQQQDDVTGY